MGDESVYAWVQRNLADPEAESATEVKVTFRISHVDASVLDLIASQFKKSRTACGKGLLVSAINQAANMIAEQDNNFAGALQHVIEDARQQEADMAWQAGEAP